MSAKRPCYCDTFVGPAVPWGEGNCCACWLWHNDAAFRAGYGKPAAPPAPSANGRKPCPECQKKGRHVELKPTRELVPGLADPIPEPEIRPKPPKGWAQSAQVRARHVAAFRWLLRQPVPPPGRAQGDGIVYVGGGRYWPMIAVALRMVRDVTDLPVQVWHRGAAEPVRPGQVADLEGVTFHDATKYPCRVLRGWECKAVALLHCGLRRVLYFDADAYPVADPRPLLETAAEEAPFAFWGDLPGTANNVKWPAFGLAGDNGVPPVQGGQLAIHRAAFWRELVLAHWLNQHSDYSYSHMYGDQDAWRVTLAAAGRPYRHLGPAPWQHPAFVCPLGGRPAVVHRCRGKLWADGSEAYAAALPGERRAWTHLARVAPRVAAEQAFGLAYASGRWGRGDRSGGGSTAAESAPYLGLVNGLARSRGWRRVVDLGCGDGFVAARLEAPAVVGVDCHAPHLERLRREAPGREWLHLDIDRDRERLPAGDAALLKDVLHHWPSRLVSDWLAWARACGKWRAVVLTYDCHNAAADADCLLGGYRPLSCALPPLRDVPGLARAGAYLHKEVSVLTAGSRAGGGVGPTP